MSDAVPRRALTPSGALACAGAALAALVIAALAGLALHDRGELVRAHRERAEFVARVLGQGAGTEPGAAAAGVGSQALIDADLEAALAGWRRRTAWLAAFGAAAALAIAAATRFGARRLRARAAAQVALAHREHMLSVIVGSVQELIFRTDAEGRLSFVNARWQEAIDGAAGLVGRRLAEIVEHTSRADAEQLFAGGKPATRRALVTLGGAGHLRFEVAVAPLLEGGRITGFAGSAVDVTAREAAQTRLREQLAFSALLVDAMPVPVALLDRDGRYLRINRAWEAFTTTERARAIGLRAQDLMPPEDAALHETHYRALLGGGGQRSYEASFLHRDGRRSEIAVTAAALPDREGQPGGILVCLVDISEMREAERATSEARDAAEEASRAKSEFIANISHELRTPLQSIIGFSELGISRAEPHAKLVGMFADIHNSGQRMLALVNDLLDVSKIESTVGTFHLERTDLRPLVREVLRELDPLLAQRRLRVACALGELPLVAKVDPRRLQQVVRNVLANAVKFSPPGSTIEVEGGLEADSRIELSVRDRGPGIPAGEVEKIFEAFVQSSKTKDGSGGTGLGLAICRKIVEIHGGAIRAENADGGGSRFTIRLPARGFAETVI